MWRSKRVISTALLSLLISGCTQPDKHDQGDAATFYIVKAHGEATMTPVEPSSVWKIPTSISLTFNACLKDFTTNTDLRRQKFAVEVVELRQRIEDVETLPDGCLKWTETLPFNYLAKRSTYVKLERDILGTGVYPGKKRIHFAVNPWAVGSNSRDGGSAVIYLDTDKNGEIKAQQVPATKLVEGAKVLSALNGEMFGPSNLTVREVSVKTIREGNGETGFFVKSTITANPYIKVQNADGEEEYLKINGASFDVIAHLVANNVGVEGNSGKKVLLTARQDEVSGTGRVENGLFSATVKSFVEPAVANGNLELALKLIPRGLSGQKMTAAFTGIYTLGDVGRLGGDSSGLLKEECLKGCEMEAYLKEASNYAALEKSREVHKSEPYFFTNLVLRFFQVTGGETATQRTVAYTASTCVTDRFNGSRAVQTDFGVQYIDDNGQPVGAVKHVETDEAGCLRWVDEISHHYYKPEQFNKRRVVISRGQAKRTLTFYLNPWDDKFVFGFDEREFGEEYAKKQAARRKVASRFYMGEFGYHTVRFKYDIDSFMQLEVKKTILMELQPRVLRYSGIINARKMTEALRDGLYLMKVAIQKNYLDPADPGREIRNKPNSIQVELVDNLKVPAKEYISTKTALVRVTDGLIIQPVELSMHDLRLMRTRANFLVQLQTVDERKIQAENVLRNRFRQDLEQLDRERRERIAEIARLNSATSEAERAALEQEMKGKAQARREQIEKIFQEFNKQLNETNRVIQPYSLLDNETFKAITDAFAINDFTTAKLPSSEEMNLDEFIEPDSGLAPRTFVGPVIFLSNAYKDSVRATDNLDEAKCGRKVGQIENNVDDESEEEDDRAFISESEKELFKDITMAPTRENPFYTYSQYFGSLKHLCNTSVDQLIQRERDEKKHYFEKMSVLSSLYNFAYTYGLNYLSLKDIPLKKFDTDCKSHNVLDCMHVTSEATISRAQAAEAAHGADLSQLTSDRPSFKEREAVCKIMMDRVDRKIRAQNPEAPTLGYGSPLIQWRRVKGDWLDLCTYEPYLIIDRKLRVLDTGTDYIFLGGLQLNFNVGNSFSVSRSYGWSGSAGLEATDFIGPSAVMAGASNAVRGALGFVKPFSLKLSSSSSLNESDGTSISQQTYLVSQIAKFNLNITRYEKCTVYRMTRQALEDMSQSIVVQGGRMGSVRVSPHLVREMTRGLMVCDGEVHEQPKNVDEVYFYFTQHFTEGDMLDQADLYNHPWLLALRGIRDFATFTSVIQVQEEVGLYNYVKGFFHSRPQALGWPLSKMTDTYKQITPTYPGFYTVLNPEESLTLFPLEKRLSNTDPDCNGELGKPADECFREQKKIEETGYFH